MNRPCGLIHEILSTAAGICWAQGYPTRRIYKVEGGKYNKNKYRYFLNLNNKFLIVNNKYPFSSVQLLKNFCFKYFIFTTGAESQVTIRLRDF